MIPNSLASVADMNLSLSVTCSAIQHCTIHACSSLAHPLTYNTQWLPSVLRQQLIEESLQLDYLLCLDGNVSGLALKFHRNCIRTYGTLMLRTKNGPHSLTLKPLELDWIRALKLTNAKSLWLIDAWHFKKLFYNQLASYNHLGAVTNLNTDRKSVV